MGFGACSGSVRRAILAIALIAALPSVHGQTISRAAFESELPLEKLRPAVRIEPLPAERLSTLERKAIEPFLSAPQVFEPAQFDGLPRIVGAAGERSLFSKSDVVYARTLSGQAFVLGGDIPREWNIYRNPVALKDPFTGELLAMEAQYLGRARLLSSERVEVSQTDGKSTEAIVPAKFEIFHSVAEIRVGDRLFTGDDNAWRDLTPHRSLEPVAAAVVSIYGSGVINASKNQIVALNRGSNDAIEPGHLLTIRKAVNAITDKTDAKRPTIRPSLDSTGQALVFLVFDKVSYALLSDVNASVQVGDHLTNP